MGSKNKGRNGFYYFMVDLQKEKADDGHFYRMDEMSGIAGPLWKNLSLDEREYYNRRAKEEKLKGASDMDRKYNSLGVSFSVVEGIERELDEQERVMKATIRNIAQSSSPEALIRKPFYFCHVNYYFQPDKDSYQPAEIALAEFTLEDGLRETRHFILHPGKIPLGMKAEAQTWADKTHGIRLVDKPGEEIEREGDFVKVFSNIVNFLKNDAGVGQGGGGMVLPVMYSMPDSLNNNTSLSAVKSCMNFLSGCAHENRDLFRVYPLPELFYHLWKKFEKKGDETPTVAVLENEVEKDIFSGAADLGCEFHEAKDLSLHCSLSMVKRWVFTVCDFVNKMTGIETIPGCHAPDNADLQWAAIQSSKRMNPDVKVGYVDPPPPKSPPKFVDLTKMQELRIREKEAVEEELSQAERLPPPVSAVFRGGPLPPNLNDRDFPPIGTSGRGMYLPRSKWPAVSSQRGRRQ
uniref:Protein maelstrom n=1 Tax=Lygus hesperus TaxID=30085 RepID=A0A0A9Y2N6_LYGHE